MKRETETMDQRGNDKMNRPVRAGLSALAMLLAASALPANAADTYQGGPGASLKDEPAFPAMSWAGFYFGNHVGYQWGNVDYRVFDLFNGKTVRSGSFSADGVIGGGQAGYNFQAGHWVFGLEADLGGLDLSGNKLDTTPHVPNRLISSSGGFYGDFTGRLGYAMDRTLIYAKGGAAFLNAEFNHNLISDRDTLWGWTAGAGVEYKIAPDWSAKIEYQHFDFGDLVFENFPAGKPDHDRRFTFSPTADAITLGANYYINRGYEPLK
jgi:outer membrane immunogenic protein